MDELMGTNVMVTAMAMMMGTKLAKRRGINVHRLDRETNSDD